MLENRQKLGTASGLLQACPWWPGKWNRVSFIMALNVLLQKQTILLISKTVFVLFKKTCVALLLKTPLVGAFCNKLFCANKAERRSWDNFKILSAWRIVVKYSKSHAILINFHSMELFMYRRHSKYGTNQVNAIVDCMNFCFSIFFFFHKNFIKNR